MASLDGLRTRYYAKSGVALRVADEGSIVLKMQYIGGGSVTSITPGATSMVTVTSEPVTTNGVTVMTPTTKTYDYTDAGTIAAFAAAILSDGLFNVQVVDALLGDTLGDNMLTTGALVATTDDNGVVCYEVKWDTAGSDLYTVAITPFRNFNVIRKGQGHRVHLKSIDAVATLASATSTSIRVYQRVGSVEKLIWAAPIVSTVLSSITFAAGHGKISSPECGELIVRVLGGAVTPAATSYVQITGEME